MNYKISKKKMLRIYVEAVQISLDLEYERDYAQNLIGHKTSPSSVLWLIIDDID